MSAAIDLTQVQASLKDLNRKLKRRGGDGEVLKFVRLKSGKAVDGGGYKVLKEITSGFFPKLVTKKGAQLFEIKVADVDGSIRKLIEEGPEVPSHFAIQKPGDDFATVYKKEDWTAPEQATQLWVIYCAPTGERKQL